MNVKPEVTVIALDGNATQDDIMEAVEATGFFERANQYYAEVEAEASKDLDPEQLELYDQWRQCRQPEGFWKTVGTGPAYRAIMWTISMGCG
jgi:hypothetical protein